MLPDYPRIKERIFEELKQVMQSHMVAQGGLLNEIRKSIVHEGDAGRIEREDGSIQEINFRKTESAVEFKKSELDAATPDDLIKKLKIMAEDLVAQQAKAMFETLGQEIEKVGNSVSAEGKPFTADLFLAGIEKVLIDFDPLTNEPLLPKIVMHPNMMSACKKELEKLESAENKKKFDEIIEKKRQEWLVREDNRKLVG